MRKEERSHEEFDSHLAQPFRLRAALSCTLAWPDFRAINQKAVPTLKKQRGFIDEIVLVSDTESDRVLAISFWDTRQDAELYHREQFPKIQDSVRQLLEWEPLIRRFNVHAYIGQKIAAEKAA